MDLSDVSEKIPSDTTGDRSRHNHYATPGPNILFRSDIIHLQHTFQFNYCRILIVCQVTIHKKCSKCLPPARMSTSGHRLPQTSVPGEVANWHASKMFLRIMSSFTIGSEYTRVLGPRWRSWLRHCATSQKVAGSIPDGVTGIFHWHNPSGRTMALGSTQPLTEMSTGNISWGVKAAGA